ncbi:MAG: hypothetical protein H8E84_04950 [Flavobacteriales bacterium]|nr:hypothetical protein [Flavobacteriales bacterium]
MPNPKISFIPKNPTRKLITNNKNGSTTICYYKEINGVLKYHNFNGPAKINEEENVKEFYIFGIQYSETEFKKLSKIS